MKFSLIIFFQTRASEKPQAGKFTQMMSDYWCFFMKIIQFFLFAEIFNIHHRNVKLIRWSSHSR